jgi:hypothetical protein
MAFTLPGLTREKFPVIISVQEPFHLPAVFFRFIHPHLNPYSVPDRYGRRLSLSFSRA